MSRPPLRMEVDENGWNLQRTFGEFARRQLPFASAVALTRTAESARDFVRFLMDAHFEVRRRSTRSRTPVRGVSILGAKKSQWPHPTAVVGTLDEFMVDHILGRERVAKEKTRTIPTQIVPRKTKTGKFRKPWKASTLLEGAKSTKARKGRSGKTVVLKASKKALLVQSRDRLMILKKPTKRAARAARRRGDKVPLKAVWRFSKSQEIEERWPFVSEVHEGAQAKYAKHFRRELIDAMLSAKKKWQLDASYRRVLLKMRARL